MTNLEALARSIGSDRERASRSLTVEAALLDRRTSDRALRTSYPALTAGERLELRADAFGRAYDRNLERSARRIHKAALAGAASLLD